MLQSAGLGDGGVQNVRGAVDGVDTSSNPTLQGTVQAALRRVFGAFAILMTSVGMPMWLAGEEFGDVHDTDYSGVDSKQQDPVQWNRAMFTGNAALKAAVAKLIALRTSHPALQRDEVEVFYFHPQFDDNDAPRVFLPIAALAARPWGWLEQVIVIANMGSQPLPTYNIPGWRWSGSALTEVGYLNAAPMYNGMTGALSLSLNPFEARVFTT